LSYGPRDAQTRANDISEEGRALASSPPTHMSRAPQRHGTPPWSPRGQLLQEQSPQLPVKPSAQLQKLVPAPCEKATVFLHSYAPLLSMVLGEPGRETQPNRVAFYARSLMDREGSKGRLLSPGLSGDDRRSFSVVESIHATSSLIRLFPLSVRPRRKALSTLPCSSSSPLSEQ